MTVREILKESALLLGEEQLSSAIEQRNENQDAEIARKAVVLTSSFNAVKNDIALNYQPLETASSVEGKNISFDALSPLPLKIIAVYGEDGTKIPFKVEDGVIVAKSKAKRVRYFYIPSDSTVDAEFEYGNTTIGKWAFIYGVCSQYCLSEGRYEESANWESKYRNSAGVMKPFTRKRLKAGNLWGL